MAIGGNYEGNFNGNSNGYQGNGSQNSNKPYENTYYSRLRFKSDNDVLSVQYRSGLMILDLGSLEQNGFKVNSNIAIHLSAIKAHMLVNSIDEFLKYRAGSELDPEKGFGVAAGMGEKITFISFSTDADRYIYITIGKFDTQGRVIESYKFRMNHNYNYALSWNNLDANDLSKVYDDDAEIAMLRNAIEDFSRSSNGAIGYAVADTARWDTHRLNKRIDQMFDKLGIEKYTGGGNNRNYGTNNFLDNAASTSRSTTLDEMENLLDD